MAEQPLVQRRNIEGPTRVPPQAEEVERYVLGALLIDPEAIPKAIEVLDDPSCFYHRAHQKIYEAICQMFNRDDEAVDQITVAEELRKRGDLEDVGGSLYLAQLAGEVPTSANVEYHARIIFEKALLRRLIDVSTQTAAESYDAAAEVENILDRAEERIFSIAQGRLRRGFVGAEQLFHRAYETIERMETAPGFITGVPMGYPRLDELLAGLQRSDLIIIAGRPSMGKTAFALDIARHAALSDSPRTVAIFSIEMADEQIAHRLLCAQARVNLHRLRTRRLSDEKWRDLSHAVGYLAEAPLYVDDAPTPTVLEIKAKARRLKSEVGKLDLVVVDYLQLIGAAVQSDSRTQEISEISRALKALARELEVPVIACSQLSRAPEMRGGDHRPQLSDLRESGAIEQDADVVMFVYRPKVYGVTKDRHGELLSSENVAEIMVEKQRNGPTDTIQLLWIPSCASFENLAPEMEPPPASAPEDDGFA